MMDEEELSNQQSRIAPGAAQPEPEPMPEGVDPEIAAERQAAGRPASPAEEKMFATLAKQALQFLTTEQAGAFLLKTAKDQGPEAALASAVSEAVGGVLQAAEAGGVQITPEVKGAATQVVVTAMAAIMAEGGVAEDPQALAESVLGMLNGEQDGAAV